MRFENQVVLPATPVWRGGFAPRQFESGQLSTLDGAEGSY
jgi:hypothetical protein